MMARRRILLLLKPLDMYSARSIGPQIPSKNPKILCYLENRRKVHMDAINYCQDVLRRKFVEWETAIRNCLSHKIRNVDLVVTVGGDGTLLQASHFMDDTVPVLGVNSDPTQPNEVAEFSGHFDASRSTGYLCGATVENFEEVLDEILEGQAVPAELARISMSINSEIIPTYALNDILVAHPCPATVSRFSFRIRSDKEVCSDLVHCRSSGLRVSSATGSSAAMFSAGGFAMPIFSRDLQYMVREPNVPRPNRTSMHGLIRSGSSMEVSWFCKDGFIYVDGSHVSYDIRHGDILCVSSNGPVLRIFLPTRLLV